MLLFSISFVTMTLFCLAMGKHRKQIISLVLPSAVNACFRPLAWLMLLLSFYLSVDLYGWSIGPAFFFGMLSGCLLPFILLLTYRPAIILMLAGIQPIIFYMSY
jgi:hypothetical protein